MGRVGRFIIFIALMVLGCMVYIQCNAGVVEEPVIAEAIAVTPQVLTQGEEEPEDTFRYYEIPENYTKAGGYFPEEVQRYLLDLCTERELDYPIVVALIERESGYKSNAVGDNGNSYGYGQVYKRWHKKRMAEEGVTDLTDAYGNLRVCTSYLKYIKDRYGDNGSHYMLMVYNMGEPRALKAWGENIYSTEYSRSILQRAEEIQQELARN